MTTTADDERRVEDLLAPLAAIPPVTLRPERRRAPGRTWRPLLVGFACLAGVVAAGGAIVTAGRDDGAPRPATSDPAPVVTATLAETVRPAIELTAIEVVGPRVEFVGNADVFEATVQVRLRQGGQVIAETFVTATCGSGCRGTFEGSIDAAAGVDGPATLELFTISAEDGAERDLVRWDVVLAAGGWTAYPPSTDSGAFYVRRVGDLVHAALPSCVATVAIGDIEAQTTVRDDVAFVAIDPETSDILVATTRVGVEYLITVGGPVPEIAC